MRKLLLLFFLPFSINIALSSDKEAISKVTEFLSSESSTPESPLSSDSCDGEKVEYSSFYTMTPKLKKRIQDYFKRTCRGENCDSFDVFASIERGRELVARMVKASNSDQCPKIDNFESFVDFSWYMMSLACAQEIHVKENDPKRPNGQCIDKGSMVIRDPKNRVFRCMASSSYFNEKAYSRDQQTKNVTLGISSQPSTHFTQRYRKKYKFKGSQTTQFGLDAPKESHFPYPGGKSGMLVMPLEKNHLALRWELHGMGSIDAKKGHIDTYLGMKSPGTQTVLRQLGVLSKAEIPKKSKKSESQTKGNSFHEYPKAKKKFERILKAHSKGEDKAYVAELKKRIEKDGDAAIAQIITEKQFIDMVDKDEKKKASKVQGQISETSSMMNDETYKWKGVNRAGKEVFVNLRKIVGE